MNIPEEFKDLCRNLGPEMSEFVSSLDDLVAHSLIGIDAKRAMLIRPFLDQFLSGGHTADQLKSFWWSMPATMVFHNGDDVLVFLTRLQEVLSASP
jgi:hypothetical protein